jgi:hypothetical protein
MFKKIMKPLALVCAMLIGLSAIGCADTSWAVKVDNITVPAGVYISYLYTNREKVLSQASSSSSATSSDALTLGSSSKAASKSSSSDAWTQKIENQNAYSWAVNNALQSSEEMAMAEELAAKKKITITSDEKTSLASYVSQIMSENSGFASNGVVASSFQRVINFSGLLTPKLIDAYYGKKGENPVSDTDLLNYYTTNFADVKQIYITTIDDNGNALPDDKLKEIQATVNSIYTQLQADKSKFDSLQTTYDQDTTDRQNNPAGFIFPKNSSTYALFADTAFNTKIGDVSKTQSAYGWHILYRVPADTSASIYTDSMKTQVLDTMKADDFKALLDAALKKAKVVENKNTLNRYSPKNLKDS